MTIGNLETKNPFNALERLLQTLTTAVEHLT